MASIISQIICGTKELLTQGFRSLPVILNTAMLVLGMAQGNVNLIFFFIGLAILSPLGCLIVNLVWELIYGNASSYTAKGIVSVISLITGVSLGFTKGEDGVEYNFNSTFYLFLAIAGLVWIPLEANMWQMPSGSVEQCNIFPVASSAEIINVVPSYWLTIMAFFFSYLIANASDLYNKQTNTAAPKAATEARKFQTMTSMVLLVISAIIFTILRYSTNCESGLGVIISWLLGSGLAYGWFTFMRQCGLGRLDDIFGISTRLLPMQSYEEPSPTMCLPTA